MFEAAAQRILYDHTKFQRRALHALLPLADFDIVIVDWLTPEEHLKRLRQHGVDVIVAQPAQRTGRDDLREFG